MACNHREDLVQQAMKAVLENVAGVRPRNKEAWALIGRLLAKPRSYAWERRPLAGPADLIKLKNGRQDASAPR